MAVRPASSGRIAAIGPTTSAPLPADARARLVRLTDRGRSAIPIGANVIAQIDAEWTAHLGPRRMSQLRETLERLREITDPWAKAPARPGANRSTRNAPRSAIATVLPH